LGRIFPKLAKSSSCISGATYRARHRARRRARLLSGASLSTLLCTLQRTLRTAFRIANDFIASRMSPASKRARLIHHALRTAFRSESGVTSTRGGSFSKRRHFLRTSFPNASRVTHSLFGQVSSRTGSSRYLHSTYFRSSGCLRSNACYLLTCIVSSSDNSLADGFHCLLKNIQDTLICGGVDGGRRSGVRAVRAAVLELSKQAAQQDRRVPLRLRATIHSSLHRSGRLHRARPIQLPDGNRECVDHSSVVYFRAHLRFLFPLSVRLFLRAARGIFNFKFPFCTLKLFCIFAGGKQK
jgi:hypothetical protein